MKACFLLSLLLLSFPLFASIEIRGGTNFGTIIPNGDTTPRTTDGTDFGDINVGGSMTVSFQAKAIGQQETIAGITEDGNAWSISSGGGFGAVPAGSARTFTVKLDPTSAGYKSATISIVTASSGIYTFKVEANALGEPEIVVRGQLTTGQNFINISDGDSTPNTVDGTLFTPQGVADGAQTHVFQIENTGTAQLTIDSITDNSTEFSISGAPTQVGVGVIQTFSVKFNPTSSGTKTATITIQNNDANEDPFTFTVTGTGLASQLNVRGGDSQTLIITNGDDTPRTLDNTDFGSVVAGSAAVTKVFKIENNGNEDLFVTSVSEDANAFRITGAPSPVIAIPPGGSNNFNIILETSTAGLKYGTVSIISNDPDDGVFTFDITASATGDPEIVVRGQLNALTNFINVPNNDTTPTTADGTDFGSLGVNDGFVEHRFQIENTGNARLNIASIIDDSNAFSIVDIPSSISAGGSTTFGVRFNPGSFGTKTATITIDNDDPDGGEDPYTFQVTGIGVFPVAQVYGGTNFGEFIANNDDSPTTLDGTDFGTVAANNGSVTKTFRIKNEGNATLTVLGFSESGAAFSFSSTPSIPAGIAAGSSRDFSIKFEPTSAGSKTATVTLATSDTVNGRDTYSFDIIGEATGVADLEVAGHLIPTTPFIPIANGDTTPTTTDGTDFGSQSVSGGSVTRTFQITNTGSAQLVIDSITETSEHFSVSDVPGVVGVNQSKTFNVAFNPTSFGTKSTTISIFTNAGNEETFTFKVRGVGKAAQLELWYAYGDDGIEIPHNAEPDFEIGTFWSGFDLSSTTEWSGRHYELRNTGNDDLLVVQATLDGPAFIFHEPFGSTTINYTTNLSPGGVIDIPVAFSPTSAGVKSGTLNIFTTDPTHPTFTVPLGGIANGDSDIAVFGQLAPTLPFTSIPDGSTTTTTGNGTEFGDKGVNDGGTSHTFRIKNDGDAQLVINAVTETSPHFSVSGAPTIIGVNQSKEFTITFNPTSLGTKTATITIDSNAPGLLSPYTFTVRGIGEAPNIAVTGGTNFGQNIVSGDVTPSDIDGTDFGNVNADSTVVTRTFRIENNGNETLTIMGFGSSNSDFTLAGVPGITNPIAPSGVNEFTVAFDPSTTGFRTATISLVSNDPDENPFTFAVEGFGTDDSPEIKVTGRNSLNIVDGDSTPQIADGTAFGQVDINGPTVSQTFTVENTGTGTLNVTSISENGARFNITGDTSGALLPGESLDFELLFNPDTEIVYSATVTIISDDANEGTFTFSTRGTGTSTTPPPAPEIAVKGGQILNVNISNGDTTPRAFDGTDVGSIIVGESKERTFRIENSGDADLNISQIVLVGAPGAVTSIPSVVAAGGTADFIVTIAPQVAGTQTRSLRIFSDDSDESPFTFDLTATGVDPANPLSIEEFQVIGENLELTFISDPAKTYQIAYSFDLVAWNEPGALGGLLGDINAQTYLITGVVNPSNPRVFLRVQEE